MSPHPTLLHQGSTDHQVLSLVTVDMFRSHSPSPLTPQQLQRAVSTHVSMKLTELMSAANLAVSCATGDVPNRFLVCFWSLVFLSCTLPSNVLSALKVASSTVTGENKQKACTHARGSELPQIGISRGGLLVSLTLARSYLPAAPPSSCSKQIPFPQYWN